MATIQDIGHSAASVRAVLLALLALLVTATIAIACGGPDGPERASDCGSVGGRRISQEEAEDTGRLQASHLTQGGRITDSVARLMSRREANGVFDPPIDAGVPDTCVWLVTIEGSFYEPGPPADEPEELVCGRIDLILPESGGEYRGLTFREIDEC